MSNKQLFRSCRGVEQKNFVPAFLKIEDSQIQSGISSWKEFKPLSPLKTRESLNTFPEIDENGLNFHQNVESYDGARQSQKNYNNFQTIPKHQNKKLNNCCSLQQLQQINDKQFSFQLNQEDSPPQHLKKQKQQFARKSSIIKQIRPKIAELNNNKNKLYDECIKLKKQFIKFERYKKFIFEDLEKKISKQLIEVIVNERKEKEKMRDLLELSMKQLQQAKTMHAQIESEKKDLSETLVKYQQTLIILNQELRSTKEEVSKLFVQNQDFFNQTCSLQEIILKREESIEKMKSELKKIKEDKIPFQNSQQKCNADEGTALEKEIKQFRMEIQIKIKQKWGEFNEICDVILPLSQKLKEHFLKLDAQSTNLNELTQLKEKAQEKIDSILSYQNINYTQLNELQKNVVMYKLSSLVGLMTSIKQSVFDFIDQNRSIFNKNFKTNISTLVQQCNKSLSRLESCSMTSLKSSYIEKPTYFERKQEERTFTRQVSDKYMKQSMITLKTTESQVDRGLANSYSQSKFFIDNYNEIKQNKEMESFNKLNNMKGRLDNLRRKVKSNLQSIL